MATLNVKPENFWRAAPSGTPDQEEHRNILGGWVWMLLLSFVLHDGEEVLTMARWIQTHKAALQQIADLGRVGASMVENLPASTGEVMGAVLFEGLLIFLATVLLQFRRGKGSGLLIYAAILGAFTLHVLTHALQAVWFGGYTPGLVTAILVIPPASFYLYRLLFRATSLSPGSALATAFVGSLLLLPLVVLAHYVGRMLF